jgi:hypothetical protein
MRHVVRLRERKSGALAANKIDLRVEPRAEQWKGRTGFLCNSEPFPEKRTKLPMIESKVLEVVRETFGEFAQGTVLWRPSGNRPKNMCPSGLESGVVLDTPEDSLEKSRKENFHRHAHDKVTIRLEQLGKRPQRLLRLANGKVFEYLQTERHVESPLGQHPALADHLCI